MNRSRLIAPYRGVRYYLGEYTVRPPENVKELLICDMRQCTMLLKEHLVYLKKDFLS